MASTIINFLIDNLLSNFIEIDKSKTYTSLLSGILELKNIKIKKESFSYMNLPYFILDIGFIGKLKIEMNMPFFYSYPINIYITDIFIYAKQKDINNLNEKEEINSIKDFKNKRLEMEENIINKLEEIENTESSIFNQIINNININVENLVFRFEDKMSNVLNPFSIGIILREFKIISIKENNDRDFTYKSININDLNLFMDCSNSHEKIKYDKYINNSIKNEVSLEMNKYLGDAFNFYLYCLNELNTDITHEYILYKLNTELRISINYNLDNNNPKYELYSNEIERLLLKFNLNQISNLFLLLSYYNLFYYYQLGLSRYIYNKNLNEKEKEKYIIEYLEYYYQKYKEKKLVNSNNLKKIEENIKYNDIKNLRKIALNYIYNLYIEQKEIEQKIKIENNKWFFSYDKNLVKELNEKLNNIKNTINQKIKYHLLNEYNILLDKDNNNDTYRNLPDDFIFYVAKLHIKEINLKIYEIDNKKNNNNDLLDFSIENMIITYTAKKFNNNYSLSMKNFVLNQNIINNKEYDKIIIIKNEKDDKFISIEYQTNRDEIGNYINKIIFKSNIQIILFINLYLIQYIHYNILSCLYTFISFIEISRYANDNIKELLQLGYIINESKKFNKKKLNEESFSIKYDYDINFINPMIIIPQDIFNSENKNCIIITADELTIKSNLLNENLQRNINISQDNLINETNSNYESCFDESNLIDNIYDKYFLKINGIQVFLSNYCIKEDNYKSFENIFIHKFNLSILYKTLIEQNYKNNNCMISCFTLDINYLYLSVDEFEILFLLAYFKKLKSQNEDLIKNKIINENDIDEIAKKYNDEKINEFIKKLESKRIITKNEFIFFQKPKININKENNNDIINEEDFYKKQNEFVAEIKINEIKFIIDKIYPDLTKEIFLELHLNNLSFSKFINYENDSLMKIYLKGISLVNEEKDIDKNVILPKEFQLLMENDDPNINCIIYSSIYKKNINEYITNIDINNLGILISFDTITRIYIFFMYYYYKYQDIQNDTKNYTEAKKSLSIRQSIIQTERNSRYSIIDTNIKQHKISNQNILKIRLNNSYYRIPSDEKNTDKPIFSTKLNIFYEQLYNSEKENIYDINNKALLKKKLLFNNSNMNIMIYESNFDIIFFNQKEINNDKIILNYRIQYRSKYSYFFSKKNSISNTNIIVEPIILNINLYQLKYLINLYYDLMKFLYESLYSNYIPFLKPEKVIYVKGKPIVINRRSGLKNLFYQVKELNQRKNQQHKKSNKEIKGNIKNSFYLLDLKLDKIHINILDDNYNFSKHKKEKRILLALEISKIIMNKIYNSNPKDKINIGNDIIGILTGSQLSIDNYIIHNLYNYMICTLTSELYYYNLEYSDFEPIIEPLNMKYLFFQTNPIFRSKTEINIENMINIDITTNFMKVLNIFMLKFFNEIDKGNMRGISIKLKKKSNQLLKMMSKNNIFFEEQEEEVIIKLINKTGVLVYFWFDFNNENKIKIKNNEIISLTNKQIYKTLKRRKLIQKKEHEKNTFSFRIYNYEVIKQINLNNTDNLYFKTIIDDKQKYILYNLKINNNTNIKEIIFESSMIIINETIYDELILSIDDDSIENDELILFKNTKVVIPLTWVISTDNIYLQLNKHSEKLLIYNNIYEIIKYGDLSEEQLKQKQKHISYLKNSLEKKLNDHKKMNWQHPKYRDYISTYILQEFNEKNSKLISIKNQKNDIISMYLDYFSIQNKLYRKNSEKIYSTLEFTKKSSEFIVSIRPVINITNSTPYDIICYNNKDESEIKINHNQTYEFYDNKYIKDDYLIKFNLVYDNENYETEFMDLNTNNNIINFSNENNDILRCNISQSLFSKNINIFENDIEINSTLSYNYILYFDVIVNNRMEFDLYGIDTKVMNKNDTMKFNSKSLSVFSSNKQDIQSLLINSNKSNFDENMKVNINAVALENVIKIEYNNNIYNILCKASNSLNYKYSNILIFEPKYILINDLDIDIYFQQINEENECIDNFRKIISKSNIPLYFKLQEKLIFKVGIKLDQENQFISYSGSFELENSMEYELKIEVDEIYKIKYPNNVFYMGNKLYLYFRIKDKITNEGNIYLFITFPEFPLLELDNRTNKEIKIYETDNDNEPKLLNPNTKIPFIWNDNIIVKDKFLCEIFNKKVILSFSEYEPICLEINDNKVVNIYNHQKDLLTGTRCIIFKESEKLNENTKKNWLESNINFKKLKSLKRTSIFIKGIGLSFLDKIPKEIFYISFYEIRYIYSNYLITSISSTTERYEFYLKNFQIDSSLNNTIKTIIYPRNQNIPSLESDNSITSNDIDFISLLITKKIINIIKGIKNIYYPIIDLCIQEIVVKIDQAIIINLINLIESYSSKLDYFKSSNLIIDKNNLKNEELSNQIKIPLDELKKEIKNKNKILINRLFLSAIVINLSFRLELSGIDISYLPQILTRLIGSLGSSLIRISKRDIRFKEIIIDNIYIGINEIIHTIYKKYVDGSYYQILQILTSFDLIGIPVQLIEKIGTGFIELVNEPRKGLLEGPSQFGKGLKRGIDGLLNGIIGGTFDSISKISGTLYNLVQNITGDNKDLIMDEDNEPSNIITGAYKGLIGGMEELYTGFTGFLINPFENISSNPNYKITELFKDLGKGLFKFAVSPINFVLRLGNSISIGTKNTFNYSYNKNIRNQRFRFPRYIKPNSPLTIYEPDLSAAKDILFKLYDIESPNIKYFSQFICENKGYNGNIAYFIMTDEIIILLSNKYEVILKINVLDLNEVNLKYNGNNFEFIILLNQGKHKIILINLKNNVFACELNCILEKIIFNKRNNDTGIDINNKLQYMKNNSDSVENFNIKKNESNEQG